MKKVLLGGVVLITLGLVGSALAADMPIKAPVVAANTWTGFYLGIDGGGVRGLNSTDSFTQTGDGNNPGAPLGGLHDQAQPSAERSESSTPRPAFSLMIWLAREIATFAF